MTRRVPLPSELQVRDALAQMRTPDERRSATVQDLAQVLGLTNSTFWRHFPQIAQEVADARRITMSAARTVRQVDTKVDGSEVALRTENARLRMQVDLAVAHIQRLTLDNRALRNQLESQTGVVRLPEQ